MNPLVIPEVTWAIWGIILILVGVTAFHEVAKAIFG